MKGFGQAKGIGMAMAAMLSLAFLGGCAGNQAPQSTETETSTQEATTESAQESAIDYKALVNKTHELPAGWEDAISIVSFKNTEDWDVDVEEKAYDAYLGLKERRRRGKGLRRLPWAQGGPRERGRVCRP